MFSGFLRELFQAFFKKHLTNAIRCSIIYCVSSANGRSRRYTEMYSRGRRGAPAKGVGRVTGARVQISPSPPTKKAHRKVCLFRWRRWRDRSRRRSRRGLGARPPPGGGGRECPEGENKEFWKHALRAHLNDYVFEWEEERRSLSTFYYTAINITSYYISIPNFRARRSS